MIEIMKNIIQVGRLSREFKFLKNDLDYGKVKAARGPQEAGISPSIKIGKQQKGLALIQSLITKESSTMKMRQ